jgi:nucleoside-diphosphate-sugar epimerase
MPSPWRGRKEFRRTSVMVRTAGLPPISRMWATSTGLLLEKHEAGGKYHAVAEEGVPLREIAEVIARGLKVPVKSIRPEEAPAHFGWLGMFASLDFPASSTITREKLGWHPTGPRLIADLIRMNYSPT